MMKAFRYLVIGVITFTLLCTTSIVLISKNNPAAGSVVNTVTDENQQKIIDGIMNRLLQSGVPIQSVQLISDDRWETPIVATYVLRSSSINDKILPCDIAYTMQVERAIDLAQKQGLKVGAVGSTRINSKGLVLESAIRATKEIENITLQFDSPNVKDNKVLGDSLLQTLSSNGLSLNKLNIYLDTEGIRWATTELVVPDTTNIDIDIPNIISKILSMVYQYNSDKDAKIGVCQIRISTSSGEELLFFVNDFQLGSTICWQTDTLANGWFSQPPPESN
jgi:hypothetical protein